MTPTNKLKPGNAPAPSSTAGDDAATTDLQHAIQALERAVKAADQSSVRRRKFQLGLRFGSSLVVIGFLTMFILVAIVFREVVRTRSRIDEMDFASIPRTATALKKQADALAQQVDQLVKLPEQHGLKGLRQLPDIVEQTRARVEKLGEDLDGKSGLQKKLDALTAVESGPLPRIRKQIGEIAHLLSGAADEEQRAAESVTRTLRSVRDTLAQIRFLTTGDTRPVRIVLAGSEPITLKAILPNENDWGPFRSTHPEWKREILLGPVCKLLLPWIEQWYRLEQI